MNCSRRNNIWLPLVCFLGISMAAHAQETAFVSFEGKVTYTLKTEEPHQITLTFQIKEGYHIMANILKESNFIPSTLSITGPAEVILKDPIFPEGQEYFLEGSEEAMRVYTGEFEVVVPLSINKAGLYTLTGELYYQACSNVKCFFPRKLGFIVEVER
jgi:hypothetical protein